MRTLNPLAVTIALALSTTSVMAASNNSVDVISKSAAGAPSFVTGNLGTATAETAVSALKQIVAGQAIYKANGNEDFTVKRAWVDALGKHHSHMSQTINGLKVYGTDMIVHANVADNNIYAVSGKLAVNAAKVPASMLRQRMQVLGQARQFGDVLGTPELAYVYLPLNNETKLSWKIEVKWDNGSEDFGHDAMFFDAQNSELLTRHAKVHQAKSWTTYDFENKSESTVGPSTPAGVLLCTNNQNCGDSSAQRAHDGASSVYDFYKDRFGRISINGSDMNVESTVHVGTNYGNAFWYNDRMWYGDGDGSQLKDLTLAHDVVGHELTHGVTEYTAGLIYANASGALNEGFSDILGAAAESFKLGNTQPDWKIGEEVMVNGSALRYMNNPTQDGYSTDWYPDRIPFTNNPNGSNDQGGVHGNSGIANLAFVLVVDGGTHPRGKSTASVPGIGLAKAEQIFYRALSTYMNASTDFDGARTATAQAASDLYGSTEVTAIETAWCAVGVGSCPTTGGNVLENGTAKTGLSASTGAELTFTMEVPAGATDINFVMSGGSGDADLYVKFGSVATDSNWDCRPYKGGNSESCTGTSTDGTYHVRIKAYAAFSGVSLTGSYNTSTGPVAINDTVTNISVSTGSWKHYTYDLSGGYADFTATISGGTGDADLYIRSGSRPTSSTYDCRPWIGGNNETCTDSSPAAQIMHVSLNGYSTASGVTLNVTANP
ncbi:MAG: M4 family metallopeptidase [Algicola sp.]|nr:M4 family metallopeptidase [Algicola sp.]